MMSTVATQKLSMELDAFLSLDTHQAIEKNIWDLLVKGAHSAKQPFHLPVLGTSAKFGPSLRTLVLRKAMTREKALIFHTDIRSAKVREIESNPKATILFYDKKRRLQFRVGATAKVLNEGEMVEERWRNTGLQRRRCYLGTAPATESDVANSGLPDWEGNMPTAEESERGRQHFALLYCQVQFIDWLWLHHKGHRRAQFRYTSTGDWTAQWITP